MQKRELALFGFVLLFIFIIVCIIFIPETYRKIRYGSFKKVGELVIPRIAPLSIYMDDYIITYKGDDSYRKSLLDPVSIETYNIKTGESINDKGLTNTLKLGSLDRLNLWKHYFIVQRVGIKDTIEYYKVKTQKNDRIIEINGNYPSNLLILDSGDLFLYNSSNATKYLYKENRFIKSNCQINNNGSNPSTTAIPLENDSILVISTDNAYIYSDTECKPIKHIHFNANEFTNGFYNRIDAPRFIPIGNNQFVVFSFNPYEHINKIQLYNINNTQFEPKQEFTTGKLRYALNSGRIVKLDNHRLLIVGGTWRISPPELTLASNQIYIYDYNKNQLERITSIRYLPFTYSSTDDYSIIVTPEQKLYIIGFNKNIKVLDLNERD